MPPIRLTYLVDSMEVGGSELNAIRTLERLDQTRFELSVVHMGADGPLTPRYEALGVPRASLSIRSFKHPSAVREGIRLGGILRRSGAQILHCHDLYSNIFGVPWARLARIPVVIASKRWQSLTPIFSRPVPFLENANRVAMRLATRVLANGEVVARGLRDVERIRPEKIRVIPNFLGPEAFEPSVPADREARRRSYGIPEGSIVAGIVARLWPVKDQATLLRAAALLTDRFAALHILFIGDGPSRADLEGLVRTLGLEEQVHFAGRLPNHPNPHGLLDISVLASLSEGFPNAVIEAMAAARPVIATRVGGVPEAVEDGATGWLISPQDPAALAQALERVLRDPQLAAEVGQRARQRVREVYSADNVLGSLMEWYSSLVPARSID